MTTTTLTIDTLAADKGLTFTKNLCSVTVQETGKLDRRVALLKGETHEQAIARTVAGYYPHTSAEHEFATKAALGN